MEYGSSFRTPIYDIAIARDGTIWVQECNGAVRLSRDGSMVEFRRQDSGPIECAAGIAVTASGEAWVSPGDALVRVAGNSVATVTRPSDPGVITALAALGNSVYYARHRDSGIAEMRGTRSEPIPLGFAVWGIVSAGDGLWLTSTPKTGGTAALAFWKPGTPPRTGLASSFLASNTIVTGAGADDGTFVAAALSGQSPPYSDLSLVRVARDGGVTHLGRVTRRGTDGPTVGAIAVARDGSFWISEPSANRVSHVLADGTSREYRNGFPTGATPYGVAVDRDGSAWVADGWRNTVEHVGVDGTVRVYGNGRSPITMPGGPVVTSDGAVWYRQTLSWHPRITRMAPNGTYREYRDPYPESSAAGLKPFGNSVAIAVRYDNSTGGPAGTIVAPDGRQSPFDLRGCLVAQTKFACFPNRAALGTLPEFPAQSVALGADGNLWFTDVEQSRIGRLSRSGTVTYFTKGLTPYDSGPQYIAAGKDGAMWFTEVRDRVGRIALDGRITEFKHRLPFRCFPGGIVAGRDGNLWFTIYHGNELVRMTPNGTIARFRNGIFPSRGYDSIIDSIPFVDALGRIWFNEPQGGRIARATLK